MKPVQTLKDETLNLEARIISAIGSVGPRNVAEISRLTGAHPETIRYKIKRQFADQGFRFRACVDYSKLGLTLYWGRLDVSPLYNRSATRLFRSLNHAAYLIHYSKILPQGYFVALFSLPYGTASEFAKFLESLNQRRIISEYSLDRVLAQRHKSMDPSFYDFSKDKWDVDWEKVRILRSLPLTAEKRETEILADGMDMLIVKELQKDARQHIVEIARKLKLNTKTLEYHYRTHVIGEGLIPSFTVRWITDSDEPLAKSTVTIRTTFKGLEDEQYKTIQSVMNKLPYLWVEDLLEDGTYIATLVVPLADFVPTVSYVDNELQFLMHNVDMGYLSTEDSFNYTIPHHMFSKGKWRFDIRKMEKAVLKELNTGVEK
jgi:hypothetical protein